MRNRRFEERHVPTYGGDMTENPLPTFPDGSVKAALDVIFGDHALTPRGIRNNNPGNIRIGPTEWRGKVTPSRDAAFETFEHKLYGIRALARLLLTYSRRYGLRTVEQIISRWAPPVENDTRAYVNAVSEDMGVRPHDLIAIANHWTLRGLVKAIIKHENGVEPYSEKTIREGIALALLED